MESATATVRAILGAAGEHWLSAAQIEAEARRRGHGGTRPTQSALTGLRALGHIETRRLNAVDPRAHPTALQYRWRTKWGAQHIGPPVAEASIPASAVQVREPPLVPVFLADTRVFRANP
jgi:hypothetical protein